MAAIMVAAVLILILMEALAMGRLVPLAMLRATMVTATSERHTRARSAACGYYPYFLIIPIGRGYRMGTPGNRTGAHSGLERLLVGVRWGR